MCCSRLPTIQAPCWCTRTTEVSIICGRTRVSTEHGLEQEFNSLDNQREAAEAYVKSQAHEGWKLIRARYDDGGYSGGSMERPALKSLLDDVRLRRIEVVVVYKVDRLTRSLADFAKLVELFDANQVSFVSVTQAFNTTTSMGRLSLNVLLAPSKIAATASSRSRDRPINSSAMDLTVCASKSVQSPITNLRGRRTSRTFSKTSRHHPFITIIRAELFDFSTVRPIWLARQALMNGWIL